MAALTWKNVTGPTIGSGAANLMRAGSQAMTDSMKGLQNVVGGVIDDRRKTATEQAQADIYGISDPNALQEAASRILQNGNPDIDKGILMKAIDDRKTMMLENQGQALQNTGQANINNNYQTKFDADLARTKGLTASTDAATQYQIGENKNQRRVQDEESGQRMSVTAGNVLRNVAQGVENQYQKGRLDSEQQIRNSKVITAGVEADGAQEMHDAELGNITSQTKLRGVQGQVALGNLALQNRKHALETNKFAYSKSQKAAAKKAVDQGVDPALVEQYVRAVDAGDKETVSKLTGMVLDKYGHTTLGTLHKISKPSKTGDGKKSDGLNWDGAPEVFKAQADELIATSVASGKFPDGTKVTPGNLKAFKLALVKEGRRAIEAKNSWHNGVLSSVPNTMRGLEKKITKAFNENIDVLEVREAQEAKNRKAGAKSVARDEAVAARKRLLEQAERDRKLAAMNNPQNALGLPRY